MARPVEHLAPLTVLKGGWKQDEARVERIVGLDDAIEGADLAYGIVSGLLADHADYQQPTDLRWHAALNAIGRIGERAARARAEILGLTTPEGDAA